MDMAHVSGVKTRARAALDMAAASASASTAPTSKRRKINHTNEQKRKSSTKSRRSGASTVVSQVPATEERCSSGPASDDEFPASCCSSNGSVGVDEGRIKVLDLEVESAQVETSTCNCGEETERREMSLPQNSQEAETNSRRRSHQSTAQNMPTELELEEFFSTAEKDIQKRFQDKYNYDIVKDVPLEGRYEWVELKP